MPPRRAPIKRNVGEEKQALNDLVAEQVTHVEFRVAFQVLFQDMVAQANREVDAPVNSNVGMVALRVPNFTRMNTPEFHASKFDKEPQEFIEGVQKIIDIMGDILSLRNSILLRSMCTRRKVKYALG
ncbi:uncharacterized protein LOC129875749 [Solanum dulcamara]|uniref:uncharacterized protein LOC129875749 n=1 Tax=Solanum dulcamara TaxID=45834 RepID=UPI0024850D04|nr:uncharacterized protein LOC129875749 [Solanum dulcamara]